MAPRAPIIAGAANILIKVQDTVDQALRQIQSKLKRFASSLSSISFDLFRGGLAGTLPLGFLLSDFRKFEDEILFLQTKLKGANLNAPFAEVEATIRQLGRTTSFTAQEVAQGATSLAQAGFPARRLIQSLQPVLDLARGGRIDLSSAAAALANTMTVFNIEGSKANEVASQFIVAARSGTLNVLDLKESLKEVVGTLKTLNIDLPTSLALVTQLARSSLKGTKAGTSLNTALLNLASKQDVIKKTLGIDINEADGSLRPFIDILAEIEDALSNLGDSTRLSAVQRIFNIRGGRAITALKDIQNIRRLADEIKNAGDEARIAAKKMDSGFGGAIRFAVSAVQDLSIELGKIISGPLTTLLRFVPPIANSLQKIFAANPEFLVGIAALPPVLLALGSAGLIASFAIGKIAGVIGGLRSVFNVLAQTIINVAKFALTRVFLTSLFSVAGVLGVVTGLTVVLSKAIDKALEPILKLGTAVSAIGSSFGDAFTLIGRGQGNAGVTVALAGIETFIFKVQDAFRIAFARIRNLYVDLINSFKDGLVIIGTAIGDFIGGSFDLVLSTILTGIDKIVQAFYSALQGLALSLAATVEQARAFFEFTSPIVKNGTAGIQKDMTVLRDGLLGVAASLSKSGDKFGTNIDKAKGFLGQFGATLGDEFGRNIRNFIGPNLPSFDTTPGKQGPSEAVSKFTSDLVGKALKTNPEQLFENLGYGLAGLVKQAVGSSAGSAPQLRKTLDTKAITTSVVGDIQTTRQSKFSVKGKNPQDKTNDLLGTISEQLGGTGDPFLKQLIDKDTAPAFQ